MARSLLHGSDPAVCGIESTCDARDCAGLCYLSWNSCCPSVLLASLYVWHWASLRVTSGMLLREGVRRHSQLLFCRLLGRFSGGMPCRDRSEKTVRCVQRCGDTAGAMAEACCQSQRQPTGATMRNTAPDTKATDDSLFKVPLRTLNSRSLRTSHRAIDAAANPTLSLARRNARSD